MKNRPLLILVVLLIISSCSHNNTKDQLVGTWIWNSSTTNTSDGKVVLTDFAQTMGNLPIGIAYSKIILNADMTMQTIIEAKDSTQQKTMESLGFKNPVNTGKWNIDGNTIKIELQSGKIHTPRYKLISDTLYIINDDIDNTIKYVKESKK